MITTIIIGLLIGSAIGGLILMGLAKSVGKIQNANYGNSFLVCLLSTVIIIAFWYFVGMDSLTMDFVGLFIINLIILSVVYIAVGKYVWKCEWMQSLKANIIWIIIYAIIMGYILSQFS